MITNRINFNMLQKVFAEQGRYICVARCVECTLALLGQTSVELHSSIIVQSVRMRLAALRVYADTQSLQLL